MILEKLSFAEIGFLIGLYLTDSPKGFLFSKLVDKTDKYEINDMLLTFEELGIIKKGETYINKNTISDEIKEELKEWLNIEIKNDSELELKRKNTTTISKEQFTKLAEEFIEIYPKKEKARYLHKNKSKVILKYIQTLKDNSKTELDLLEFHKRAIDITKAYVEYKIKMDELYDKTHNKKYWIESFPLLETYVNNLTDKLDQYQDIVKDSNELKETKVNIFGSKIL